MGNFSDEQIPWFTTKDYDPSKWDWSRPELRGQLRVGTVLESHDCSYIIVGLVTDEGVSDSVNGGFLTWSWLTSSGFMIYKQPDSTPDRRMPIEEIQAGDEVTIFRPSREGQDPEPATGRAVMPGTLPGSWVLDMGGKYGTPAVANPYNFVSVRVSEEGRSRAAAWKRRLEDEDALSNADLWELKVSEGMSPRKATKYVRWRITSRRQAATSVPPLEVPFAPANSPIPAQTQGSPAASSTEAADLAEFRRIAKKHDRIRRANPRRPDEEVDDYHDRILPLLLA